MTRNNALGLVALVASSLLVGCEPPGEGGRYRDGSGAQGAEDERPEVGGGSFTPDPACDYFCDAINDEEAVCAQYCPNGCVTIEVTRRSETDEGVEAGASLSGYCPEDFPEASLGELTCELTYAIPSGAPSDCTAVFSNEACEVALDVCLDGL